MSTLNDGSAPCTPDELLTRLEAAGIPSRTLEHAAVFTVEEARAVRDQLPGAHTKNLFLRNRKGRMWLVTVQADRVVDLWALGEALGAGRFSFASEERLMLWLGLRKGSVTPFGLVNDREGQVTFALEGALLEAELINIHPLINTRTTALEPRELMRFCAELGHEAVVLELD